MVGWLAAKVEASAGVAESLTASEVKTRIRDWDFTPDIQFEPHDQLSGSLSAWPFLTGARMARLKFSTFFAGSTSGNLQTNGCEQHVLMQGCCFKTTGTAAPDDGMKYEPTTDDTLWKTLTMGLWLDQKNFYVIYGAMGSLELSLQIGKPLIGTFDFVGPWSGAPTATTIVAGGGTGILPTLKPPVAIATGLTVHTVSTLVFRELTIRFVTNPFNLDGLNAADGYHQAYSADRGPSGTLKFNLPRYTGSGDFEIEKKIRDAVVGGLSFTVNAGGGENNQFTMTIPASSLQFGPSVRLSKENGIVVAEADFKLLRNATLAGEDEFLLLAD
jgi:hypothetical protein